MLGIQNADGSMSWIIKPVPGAEGNAKVSPVRHHQRRMDIRLFVQTAQGRSISLGVLRFPLRTDGFIERPEAHAMMRIDAHKRLHVEVSYEGRSIQKRFVLPAGTIPAAQGARTARGRPSPAPQAWALDLPGSVTLALFVLGTLFWGVAAYIHLG